MSQCEQIGTVNSKIGTQTDFHRLLFKTITTATDWAYCSGCTFTLTKFCAVRAIAFYNNANPSGILIASSSTTLTNNIVAQTTEERFGSLMLITILPPGTYYIWGKWSSASDNGVAVDEVPILLASE